MDPRLKEILTAAGEESPALPFPVLVRRLRRRGAAVNERVLRRTLDREDSGVRLLDPWPGPLAHLRGFLEGPAERGAERGAEGRAAGADLNEPRRGSAHRLWVLTGPGDDDPPDPGAPAARRVRETVRYLGHHLDARSPGDVARWVSLVREAEQLPRAA